MFSVKKWLLCVVITVFTATPLLANETHEKNHLAVSVKDGLVSLDAEDIPLSEVLEEIGKKATPSFNVRSFMTSRITASFENRPLKEVVSQLVKKNYAIVFNKETNHLKTIFLLPEGSGTSTVILDEDRDIAKIFPEPNSDTKIDVDEYIKKRHQCIDKLQIQGGENSLTAQLSFSEYVPAPKILDRLKDKVTISVLNIGWKEMAGGYNINPNYSKEEVLQDLNYKHEQFLHNILQSKENILVNSENLEMRRGAEELFQNATEQLSIMDQGVMIYGAEINGTAEKIKDLLADPKIRLIDMAECNTEIKNLLIQEGYKQTKFIILPLKPESP